MTIDHTLLQNIGGFQQNSLCHILKTDETDIDPNYSHSPHLDENANAIKVISHSPYYDDNIYQFLPLKNDSFTIFSTNIESISSKFSDITIFIESLRQVNFEFSVLCFQECFINEYFDESVIQIDGYNCTSQTTNCSRKGGLVMYVLDKYSFKCKSLGSTYTGWEHQFVEVQGSSISKSILIGNIYRPPNDLNLNYRNFYNELGTILESIETYNGETILAGDFNINLLNKNNFAVTA